MDGGIRNRAGKQLKAVGYLDRTCYGDVLRMQFDIVFHDVQETNNSIAV
jgi:hypothetical protein